MKGAPHLIDQTLPWRSVQMHWLDHEVQQVLVHWGYLAVLAGLLGEDAGFPLPGETVLMFSGFLSHKQPGLQLQWIILIGIVAATSGDNLGFMLGRKYGPRLNRWLKEIFRLDDEDIDVAKDQLLRHGTTTVFWARFIFGLRLTAGPLAGMLGMDWKEFSLYNFLGAATWVTTVSLMGYMFADQFSSLLGYFEKASLVMIVGIVILGYFLWRHMRHLFEERRREKQKPKAQDRRQETMPRDEQAN